MIIRDKLSLRILLAAIWILLSIRRTSCGFSSKVLCARMPGLTQTQRRICERRPDAIVAIAEGAKLGLKECQRQFALHRWNCSIAAPNLFGHSQKLNDGSPETAFLYAVASAGVVHSVTQACSAGKLTDCSCDRSRHGQPGSDGWKWGGCSDNIRHGMMFAKHFVDAPERLARKKTGDIRALMNLHNNLAGRLAIGNQMKLKCRCHGVSSSCELKTCWRALPSFQSVGAYLKEKYEHSIEIAPKAGKKPRLRLRGRSGKVRRRVPVSKEDLVHIHKSPNYCVQDPRLGIPGTEGRTCNKTSSGPDGCEGLCCGRGYDTRVKNSIERCGCKFIYCCRVECDVCEKQTEIYTCK